MLTACMCSSQEGGEEQGQAVAAQGEVLKEVVLRRSGDGGGAQEGVEGEDEDRETDGLLQGHQRVGG